MFAFFSIGAQELIILALVGGVLFVGLIVVLILAVASGKKREDD